MSRILVVDDEPDICSLLRYVLEQDGHEVREAYDGQECLDALPSFEPDLILLNLLMPRLDGFSVCRKLRDNPLYSALPVILTTACAEERISPTASELGIAAVLIKPFGPAEMRSLIAQVLSPAFQESRAESIGLFRRFMSAARAGRDAQLLELGPLIPMEGLKDSELREVLDIAEALAFTRLSQAEAGDRPRCLRDCCSTMLSACELARGALRALAGRTQAPALAKRKGGVLLLEARCRALGGDAEAALDILREALGIAREGADGLLEGFRELGEPKTDFRPILREALLCKGHLCLRGGRIEEALACYEELARIEDPELRQTVRDKAVNLPLQIAVLQCSRIGWPFPGYGQGDGSSITR